MPKVVAVLAIRYNNGDWQFIISNTSSGVGGGIYNLTGKLVLLNSTLSGNASIGDRRRDLQ